MSKVTIQEMIEEVLKIEKVTIKKRHDTVKANPDRFGKLKVDSEAVNRILATIEAGGIGDED